MRRSKYAWGDFTMTRTDLSLDSRMLGTVPVVQPDYSRMVPCLSLTIAHPLLRRVATKTDLQRTFETIEADRGQPSPMRQRVAKRNISDVSREEDDLASHEERKAARALDQLASNRRSDNDDEVLE
jgi:hypothetical protein